MPISSRSLAPQKALIPGNAPANLRARKQQFMQEEIWAAAIDLFAAKGFDDTTVDDIAQASGVSRRSFFRYFSSKNDLMAQAVLSYGVLVTEIIANCPPEHPASAVLRHTVLTVAQLAATHPRTRAVMEIAGKYPAAREAQLSRFGQVQEQVAQAFARRGRQTRKSGPAPKVFAALTMGLIDTALQSWFEDGKQDIAATVKQVFTSVDHLLCRDSPL